MRRSLLAFGFFFLFSCLSGPLAAQATPTPAVSPEQADALYQAEDWEKAAAAYEGIAAREPGNGEAWMRLGAARHALGRYAEAIEAYEKAGQAGYTPVIVAFRSARANARLGRKDLAFEGLDKAVATGFRQTDRLRAEADFEGLRADPRFAALIARVEQSRKPCTAAPEFRQFDFWIGEWVVELPDGTPIATSSIQLILDDCVILENYVQDNGYYSGKSFSLYDRGTKRWEQRYVDSQGSLSAWSGGLEGADMRFAREDTAADGSRVLHRMTYSRPAPDRVRQLVEDSRDGGKTWTSIFDGIYKKRK